MYIETNFLESPTGAKLAWHHEAAQGQARGVIMLSHGMAEHSKRYKPFAEFLAGRGYHTYGWDHRGHGETTAADAIRGQFAVKNGMQKVIADTIAMRNFAATNHPGLPIILFGHSMGAYIAFNMAIAHPEDFAGVAVWNNDFSSAKNMLPLKIVLAITAMFKGSDTPATLVNKLTFDAWGEKIPGHKTPFDWLSHDDMEVAAYIEDPLCGFACTVSLWRDLAAFIETGAKPANWSQIPKDKPFHLLGGGQDPASNYAFGTDWLCDKLKEAGFTKVTEVIFPEARHETLNDLDRDAAMKAFADWADQVTAQP
ncbi:alpha/beta fold hydrolase [Rhizobium sp. L1K21]|uniref:alpha/beta fold hydrolase n=1 Tax=Rhizobium sp. L1K21 TaxID=2954933 RepID=UPI0020925EEC|nr:alpha/beta hydrolase [Rhizobium sp. L1K21]MCO6185615.1 alpha/beta hydrolase [Rhizobium sp. L1K21]